MSQSELIEHVGVFIPEGLSSTSGRLNHNNPSIINMIRQRRLSPTVCTCSWQWTDRCGPAGTGGRSVSET